MADCDGASDPTVPSSGIFLPGSFFENMPEDVLILIFSELPLETLAILREVNGQLRDFVDNTPALWKSCLLHDIWPNQLNIHLVRKAAEFGNYGALVKLGLYHMYYDNGGENLVLSQIIELFHRADTVTASSVPATWILFRPPWTGASAKARLFDSLLDQAASTDEDDRVISYMVASIMNHTTDPDKEVKMLEWYQKAADKGCGHSAMHLWQHQYIRSTSRDKGSLVKSIRSLRNILLLHPKNTMARFTLASFYATEQYGGIAKDAAVSYVNKMFLSSSTSRQENLLRSNQEITPQLRQILIDWLFEVITLRNFPHTFVHSMMKIVDRYLAKLLIYKQKLQLLGITALLLLTRLKENDVLTIREAAWLTDNTYGYFDVVKMMGEIMEITNGKLDMPTVADYLKIVSALMSSSKEESSMAYYLSDMSVMYCDLYNFSEGVLAVACFVLARAINLTNMPSGSHIQGKYKVNEIFPKKLAEFTGLSFSSILPCILALNKHSVNTDKLVNLQSVKLVKIHEWYKNAESSVLGTWTIPQPNDFLKLFNIKDSHNHGGYDGDDESDNESQCESDSDANFYAMCHGMSGEQIKAPCSQHQNAKTNSVLPLNTLAISSIPGHNLNRVKHGKNLKTKRKFKRKKRNDLPLYRKKIVKSSYKFL